MNTPKLDTRPWNLGLPLVLLAACGRTLPLPSEESESDTDDPSTVTIDPTEQPETTVDPDECQEEDDCPPGLYCGYNNQCVEYYDYCSDGGCCYDECCYDGCHYYECYSDYECAEGYVCNYNSCEPGDNQPTYCTESPIGFLEPQLILEYSGEINLAFVDAPGTGHELAIATGSIVQVVGSGATTVLAEDLEAEGLGVGDLEGDGDEDIIVLTPSGLFTFLADPDAGFVAGPMSPALGSNGSLAIADFDGNGAVDAFVRTPSGTSWYVGAGDGSFTGGDDVAPETCGFTVTPNPQSATIDDIFYGEGGQAWYAPGTDGEFTSYSIGGKFSGDACPIDAGDFDADGMTDVAVLDASGSGGVTTWWAIGAEQLYATWSPPSYNTAAAMVDLDLDGRDDLALAGSTSDITVRFGSSDFDASGQPLGCYVVIPIGFLPQTVVFGDFDGDGDRDLVGADGEYVFVANAAL